MPPFYLTEQVPMGSWGKLGKIGQSHQEKLFNMRRFAAHVLLCLLICLIAVGCDFSPAPPPLPTVANVQAVQTAVYLTKNAPPTGFEQSVTFPQIDDNLSNLPGWHYVVALY